MTVEEYIQVLDALYPLVFGAFLASFGIKVIRKSLGF